MSTGTIRQFPVFGTDATGYDNTDAIEPVVDGESITGAILGRPSQNLRERTEVVRDVLEDLQYLADADRSLMLAGPGTVTWPGSTTAGATGIFTLSDVLFLLPALTPGSAQVSPVPPVQSVFGSLTLTRDSDSMASIGVASLLRGYHGGDKINITVVAGAVYSCELADETTMSIIITATGATTLADIIASLNALLNANGDNVCAAALIGGAAGPDLIEVPQALQYVSSGYDGEGHTLTPAQLAAFFAGPGDQLAEGDSLCVQYSTMIDTSPATDGGRRQALAENANTSITSAMLFNSRRFPSLLPNAIPICKVINGRLCFINGQQVPAGASAYDLGLGVGGDAAIDMMRNCIVSGFAQGAHAALTFAVGVGTYWRTGQRLAKVADTVALTNNATNYVYIDTDGNLASTTVLATAVALTRVLLYRAVTVLGAIDTVTDLRRNLTHYNSRAFITVGGSDCDFEALESAVAWADLMVGEGEDTYFEIVIQGAVTMVSTIVLSRALRIRQNDPANGSIATPSGLPAFSVPSGTIDKVSFKDITFNIPTTAGSSLVEIGGTAACSFWEIDNCTVNGGADENTISVLGSAAHDGWRITRNKFSGMAHTAAYASILLERMRGAVVEGNHITGGTGDAFDAGIKVMYGAVGNVIENNTILTGGLAIEVSDDDFAGVLDDPSQGNRVTKNFVEETRATAVRVAAHTIVDGNFFKGCNTNGGAADGVIVLDGGFSTVNKNLIVDWSNNVAIWLIAGSDGCVIEDNIMTTSIAGADAAVAAPVSAFDALIIRGNYVDLLVGAAAGAGQGAAAFSMLLCVGAVISGNVIRNVGSDATPATVVIGVSDSSVVANNTLVNCRGPQLSAGTLSNISGNTDDNDNTSLLSTPEHDEVVLSTPPVLLSPGSWAYVAGLSYIVAGGALQGFLLIPGLRVGDRLKSVTLKTFGDGAITFIWSIAKFSTSMGGSTVGVSQNAGATPAAWTDQTYDVPDTTLGDGETFLISIVASAGATYRVGSLLVTIDRPRA
jgi:putative cofactor-binding repeat protein